MRCVMNGRRSFSTAKMLNTLFDTDGSAFIIHEFDDKYLPDPMTKDAPDGLRIVCGVVVKE